MKRLAGLALIAGVLVPARPAGATTDVWWRLFGCETGGTYNHRIVSRTGKFRGAFQFDMPTWHGVGGPTDPIRHSYMTQKFYAIRLQSHRGWRPWPYCSRRLRLR